MYIEKLAEAQRKFQNLKSELLDSDNRLDKRKDKGRSKSLVLQIDDDQEDDQFKRDNDENNNNKGILKKRRSNVDGDDEGQKSSILTNVISGANNGAQTFTQRILEKNRQRQLKQKLYRKQHDLKLAFSEFYLSLILLQNYQTLNFTGFRKILKKHDKVGL